MNVTLNEAYALLELPYGAPLESVEKQYKILAKRYQLNNSVKSLEQVYCAYRRILPPKTADPVDMDVVAMKDIFKNIFGSGELQNGNGMLHDGEDSYSGSEYSDDEVYRTITRQNQAQSEQIAKELISEEEKEKRKAEKRRAKKKKRREKKKHDKEMERTGTNGAADARNETPNGIRSSDEGEGIDPNAAFVKKSKKKKNEVISTKSDTTSSPTPTSKKNDIAEPGENGNILTKKSRLIANNGNDAAHLGDYPAAIQQFSEAIKLEPSDYRFFGNRSYCYDRIMQFDKALADADKCIELSPEWAKGYFRKGRALAGMKLFADAEKSFVQVLKLDRTCEEASKELTRVRTQQLIDMGFSPKDSEQAVLSKNTLQQALDHLLAEMGSDLALGADDVYVSDDDEFDEQNDSVVPPVLAAASIIPTQNTGKSKAIKSSPHNHHTEALSEEKKMDPTNPEGLTALWVGNVVPEVMESDLQNLFSRYGHVSSVRCLPDKFCAFVNFKSKEAAGKAMNALQNHDVKGQHLLIKFPDNPIAANGVSTTTTTKPVKQTTASAASVSKLEKRERIAASNDAMAQKVSGPVNGDECYFWRTTGCQFGAKCRWKHASESRGVDKKPWQRVKQ